MWTEDRQSLGVLRNSMRGPAADEPAHKHVRRSSSRSKFLSPLMYSSRPSLPTFELLLTPPKWETTPIGGIGVRFESKNLLSTVREISFAGQFDASVTGGQGSHLPASQTAKQCEQSVTCPVT